MEAALRTADYFVTGQDAPRVELKQTRGLAGVKEAEVTVGRCDGAHRCGSRAAQRREGD